MGGACVNTLACRHTHSACACAAPALACAAGSGAGPRSWVAPASAAVRALACIRCHARDVDLGCGLRRALHHTCSASLLAAPLLPRSLQLRSLLQSSCSRSARISPERWDVLRGLWAKRAAWSSRRGWCVGVKGAWVAYRCGLVDCALAPAAPPSPRRLESSRAILATCEWKNKSV